MTLPRLFKPFQQVHGDDIHRLMSDWFKSELGCQVLDAERDLLDHLLPSMFGYYLVQTGVGEPQWLASTSTIHCKLYLCEQPCNSPHYHCVASRPDDMAIATESIDVALLHHSLDFESEPHRALREVARTVIPGGKILIVGFNPWSLWGIWRLLRKQTTHFPWSGNFISPLRMSDWLNLLDFHVEGCESLIHGLPTANPRTGKLFGWLSYLIQRLWTQRGAVYVLVATKQVATVTPIKPRFRTVRESLVKIPIAGIAKPSTRKGWRLDRHSDS